MTEKDIEKLQKVFLSSRDILLNKIINSGGAGTKTYYNTVLKQLNKEIERMQTETNTFIDTSIPEEYKKGLDEVYQYFTRNNLMMRQPDMWANIHTDAVYNLAREMQYQISEGIAQAGRQVLRYLDTSRDDTLRQAGLEATAEKMMSGSTVIDMKKRMIEKLQNEGFMTVQYGQGKRAYQVSLDSYAAMVARSTTREAGNLARENQLVENGYDLVEISVHYPTCEICAKFQGRVYSISGKDKRFPPLSRAFASGYRNIHPNCRHVIVPWIESLQTDEGIGQTIEQSNKSFEDSRDQKQIDLYNNQQAQNRRMRQDLYQYERYKARLGRDAPQSFHAFRKVKKAGGEAWEDLQDKYRDIGKTIVDWDLVNSKDWSSKFNKITDNPKVNERIKNLSKQILRHRQGSFYEDMYVMDANTGELKGFQTQSKTKFQVDTNDSLKNAFENASPDSLIGIHNHPLSSIPSLGDLNAIASRASMKQGVIICHDGTVFTYTRPYKPISEMDYKTALTRHRKFSKMTREDKGFADLAADYQFEVRRFE